MGSENTDEQPLESFETAPDDDHGLSLDELSSAYAQLMGQGEVPFEGPDQADPDSELEESETETENEDEESEQEDQSDQDPDCELSPATIVEAMLFVGHPENEPLLATEIAGLMRGVRPQEVDGIVCELNEIYQSENCPYEIVSDGAGYRLTLRSNLGPLREKFYGRVREAKLTQAAVDVLAIVAYNEGVSRDRLEEIRGKPCAGILSQMVRRQLLRIERPEESPKRPVYFTTPRFLHLFGMDHIDDLPRSPDFDSD